jgi:hypothetical protein
MAIGPELRDELLKLSAEERQELADSPLSPGKRHSMQMARGFQAR